MSNTAAGLGTLRRERLVDQALEAIKGHMIAAGLRAGDRLPTEGDLAQSLGVSRNVVRQALSSLEALGIVKTEHGRGTFVAEMGASSNVLEHLSFWLDLDNLDQTEYFEARSVFEVGVLRLVMRRATEEDFGRLEQIVDAMEQADDAGWHSQHDAFHLALFQAAKNRFFASLGIILYRFFWGLAATAPRVHQVAPVDQARLHRRLVTGLRTRDESQVARLVRLHLEGCNEAESQAAAGATKTTLLDL